VDEVARREAVRMAVEAVFWRDDKWNGDFEGTLAASAIEEGLP